MNRYNKLTSIYKVAVNKEQRNLGEEFFNSEKFSADNRNKIFAIAAQWWSAFNGTSVYENWKFLQNDLKNLNDVIRYIKENKDSIERADTKRENTSVEMLSGIYPNFKDKFSSFNERFLAWLVSRYGEKSKYKGLHPIDQAISTLTRYQERVSNLRQKFDSNRKYKNIFNSLNTGARSPSDIMKLSINDMEAAIGLAERPKDLHTLISDNYEPERFLGQFGQWKLWLPIRMADSIAIAKCDKYSMLPDTDWCTARTFGHNLFYTYVTKNAFFLFYAIKDGASKDNLSDYQSIGIRDKKIIYNGDGTETVDGDNVGMYEADHRRLFGDYFEEIYSTMFREVERLKNIHPIEEEVNKAALGDKKAYDELTKVGDEDSKNSIKKRINSKKIVIAEETTDPKVMEILYSDKNLNVKKAVIKNPNMPIEMIEGIYNTAPLDVKKYLTYNEKIFLPENVHILNGLATLRFDDSREIDAEEARKNIAKNKKTPEVIIELFFQNEDDYGLSGYIADNINYIEKSKDIFLAIFKNDIGYSDDFIDKILNHMVSSALTPAEILEKIYDFERSWVDKERFLKNENTPLSVLEKIYKQISPDSLDEMLEISKHPNVDTNLISKMKEGKSILWQYELARNEQTPIETLEELSESKHLLVLSALFNNPSANTELILNKLIKYLKFKQQIAHRPILPETTLDALSRDKDSEIRAIIAKKENLEKEIMLRLSRDSHSSVRRAIYNNPSTPLDIVLGLSKEFYSALYAMSTTGNSRVTEYKLGKEALSIISDLRDYQGILINDGINIDAEITGDSKSTEKVNYLARRIAEVGSIVFYEADLTDLDLTQEHSSLWAAKFIEKNKEKENPSRNERLALSLAKEILQDAEILQNENEEGAVEANEDMVIDKMSNLIVWLSKSGYKKEAADVLSLYKKAAFKIKMSPVEVAIALGLLSEKALIDDKKKDSNSKKKDKKEEDVIEHLLKELKEFDLEKEAAKKGKKKSKKKNRTPTKPELWSASKAWAKRKYDVWPSAYAVGAALKRYKEKGGGWRGPKPKK